MACWRIIAVLDRETGESAGASGTFQVVGLEEKRSHRFGGSRCALP